MDDSREKLKVQLLANPYWQPDNPDDELKVLLSLLCCMTFSILLSLLYAVSVNHVLRNTRRGIAPALRCTVGVTASLNTDSSALLCICA
jgi:hypothetical protein